MMRTRTRQKKEFFDKRKDVNKLVKISEIRSREVLMEGTSDKKDRLGHQYLIGKSPTGFVLLKEETIMNLRTSLID